MYPIIIVEGPDAVGKTTWARKFQDCYDAKYLHLTLRKKMFGFQVASLLYALRCAERQPVIIDRHWPSEQIYAGVYRGGSDISDKARLLETLLCELGVFYVLCLPISADFAIEMHTKESSKRNEMYVPDARYKQVVYSYYDWALGTKYADKVYSFLQSKARVPKLFHDDVIRYALDFHNLDESIENAHYLSRKRQKHSPDLLTRKIILERLKYES